MQVVLLANNCLSWCCYTGFPPNVTYAKQIRHRIGLVLVYLCLSYLNVISSNLGSVFNIDPQFMITWISVPIPYLYYF